VKVALLESIFAGRDRASIIKQIQPFAELVERDTGAKASFDVSSLKEIEQAFNKGDIQLVILTGLEYSWMRAKNDQARALLRASIDPGATQTVVIARANDDVSDLKSLAGATVMVPEHTPFLTTYYLKSVLGKPLDEAFKTVKQESVDDLIEDVIDGKARAGVVTKSNLAVFQERKPGRYKRLKVVHESPVFPPAVVMYNERYADKDKLRRFEDALLRSNQTSEGNRVLTLYKLKGFERLPPDFDERVKDIAKQFPEAR